MPEPDWFAQFERARPPHGPAAAPADWFTPFETPPIGEAEAPRTWTDTLAGLRAGAVKGAATTVLGLGELAHRLPGVSRAVDALYDQPEISQRAFSTLRENLTPRTVPERVGAGAERLLEFAVPGVMVGRAVRAAPLVGRMAAEAATMAGVAGVQSGGDPRAMSGAAALSVLGPPVGGAIVGVGRMAQRAAAGAKEGGLGGAVAGAVRAVAPGGARQLIVQALKPRSTQVRFAASLDRSLPILKATESTLGHPIASVDDLMAATKQAKQTIQTQLNVLRDPQHAIGAEIDLTPVATAMVRSIPKKLQLESPAAAQRLRDMADVYRRRFSLDEAETLLRETNAELASFYAQYPQAQRQALLANPGVATLEAQAPALRTAIYGALDAPGQGAAARELNRRYGALLEIESTAMRRANVAARQQPESLSEQIGAVRAAADLARGTWRLAHGDLTGAADIAAAHAGRATAKMLKETQTTDALIRRAFAGFREPFVPVPMPTPRPVRGLLARGPRLTPSAETSAVTAARARSVVQRDPRTGRMRRVYLSEPPP